MQQISKSQVLTIKLLFMKKYFVTGVLLNAGIIAANAQSYSLPELKEFTSNNEFVRGAMVIVAVYIVCRFMIEMIKTLLDYNIKSKLIKQGAPLEVIRQLVAPANRLHDQIYKWIAIFAAVGMGFIIIGSMPLRGPQSLAIMAFSLAIGYFIYQRFLKHYDEPNF